MVCQAVTFNRRQTKGLKPPEEKHILYREAWTIKTSDLCAHLFSASNKVGIALKDQKSTQTFFYLFSFQSFFFFLLVSIFIFGPYSWLWVFVGLSSNSLGKKIDWASYLWLFLLWGRIIKHDFVCMSQTFNGSTQSKVRSGHIHS